ncbi:MAG: amidase, partial [Alphaproteobacteria bacterium]
MPPSAATTRRQILQAVLAGAAGLPGLRAYGATHTGADAIAACDRFTGIDFTPAEEEQIAHVIDDQLDAVRAVLAFKPANTLAPAEIFDPRLPGWRPRPPLETAPMPPLPAPAPAPTSAEDIAFAPIATQAQWLHSDVISSRELTEIYLARIARHDRRLRAYITVNADGARAEAARADAERAHGRVRGPLHGIAYGLKDLIDVAGSRTTWGAQIYR